MRKNLHLVKANFQFLKVKNTYYLFYKEEFYSHKLDSFVFILKPNSFYQQSDKKIEIPQLLKDLFPKLKHNFEVIKLIFAQI